MPDIGCTGFMLTEVMDSEAITVTTFFDKAGDPVKVATRANFFGTITKTTTGDTFLDHASIMRRSPRRSTSPRARPRSTGSATTTSWGGQGQVYAEIGHKISVTERGEVIFQGGQDDLASDPDPLGLCDSMA